MSRKRRVWLRGLAVVFFLLVVIAILGTGSFVKWIVEREGTRIVGVPVTVTGAYLNPFTGVLHFRNLRLGNPPGFREPYALKVADLDVRFSLRGLFSDPRRLHSIDLRGTEVYWEGTILKNNLKQISRAAESHSEKSPTKPDGGKNRFAIERVSVTGTRVALTQGEKHTEVAVPAIELEDLGSDNYGTKMATVASDLLGHLARAIVTDPDFLRGATQELFRRIF